MNKWEEESLTERRKNCSNNSERGRDDITKGIEKKSINSECKSIGKTKTTEQFVVEARERHGNRYDYSRVDYKNRNTKVEIVCKDHGSFFQNPTIHLSNHGCPSCAGNKQHTTESFISKSIKIHGDRYDYSKVKYVSGSKDVIIVCKKHGEFHQNAHGHLTGDSCIKCAWEMFRNNSVSSTSDFIQKSKNIHGDLYDYSITSYVDSYTKVNILCKKHGKFFQSPSCHLLGKGCFRCNHPISRGEIKFLDYLSIKNENRNFRLPDWPNKVADGIDKNNKIIYEFLGDYWHGNIHIYDKEKDHPVIKMTYGQLHKRTFNNFDKLLSLGYSVKYIWESDWKKYKSGIDKVPNIITHVSNVVLTQ